MRSGHSDSYPANDKRTLHSRNDAGVFKISPDENESGISLKHTALERVLRLLHLLVANECTRQEIFARLAPYYNIVIDVGSSSRRADRMFERDIKLLEEQGFEIRKIKAKGKPTRYSLVKGSGPAAPFLFSGEEVEILALLYNLFTDPATSRKHPRTGALVLPAEQPLHNPFAEDILTFIKKLAATLPPVQVEQFEQRIKRPSVHLNLATVTDYLPHRKTIDTMEREEVYIDSDGHEKRRVLVRAKAHNEWRVIQQLLKYGDQAELVEPASLREQMRQVVARMQSFYEK